MSSPHPLAGAWDLHVHAAPSLFPRWGDAWALAEACSGAQMGGIVLKAHHGSTVGEAALLDRRVGPLRVLGGVVLNYFSGGLAPLAVEGYVALGARIVWLPTIHAAHHAAVFGGLGDFPFQRSKLRHTPRQGLTILDDRQALAAPMQEILEVLDDSGVPLGTGHLAPAEILALQRAITQQRRRIKLLVNHVFFAVPRLSVDQLRLLAGEQTYFELCYLTLSEQESRAAAMAAALRALPDARWVLATDSGQAHNPPAPAALARLVEVLAAQGIDEALLRRATTTTPRELLRR